MLLSNYAIYGKFWLVFIKFLLTGDEFMSELHLKQPGFIVLAKDLLNIVKEFKSLERQII